IYPNCRAGVVVVLYSKPGRRNGGKWSELSLQISIDYTLKIPDGRRLLNGNYPKDVTKRTM
ncbi:MAG: hypothetical protein ACOYZ6_03915, partial [Chloroflexota bacterium]